MTKMLSTSRGVHMPWFLLQLLLLGALACGDDDSGDGKSDAGTKDAGPKAAAGSGGGGGTKDASSDAISIRFKAKVGSRAFACGENYTGVGTPGREIEPVDLRFYVHDVRLLDGTGRATEFELEQDKLWQYEKIALLDFENHEGACDQGDEPTHTTLTGTAPAGSYTGLEFTLGIPLEQNHADLSTQPSPLNKSSLFWGWNYGHIFFAATSRTATLVDEDAGAREADAGALDVDGGAGVSSVVDHFTHLGSTGCDGNPTGGVAVKKCSHPNRPTYTFAQFNPEKDSISVDFAAVKRDSDVAANAGCHSFTPATCTRPFDHLGIDFETGSLTPTTQTVFGVE